MHNPFNKDIKFEKKKNKHYTPLQTKQYLCMHFTHMPVENLLKVSKSILLNYSINMIPFKNQFVNIVS